MKASSYFLPVPWAQRLFWTTLYHTFPLICRVRDTAASVPWVTTVRELVLGPMWMQLQSLGTSTICCHPQIGYKVIWQRAAARVACFAICLCPGCDCWFITKPGIFCRSSRPLLFIRLAVEGELVLIHKAYTNPAEGYIYRLHTLGVEASERINIREILVPVKDTFSQI